MRRPRNVVQEIHVAVLGMNGSGKSALTVKYLTKRFITDYDPTIEDTYCKHETILGQENMIWIMDTVEGPNKDQNRFLGWADIFFVVYSITSLQSFEYAERLLKQIAAHDHSFCVRNHVTYLLGNKTDLDRYRQVSKSQGTRLAAEFQSEFFEINTTEEYSIVKSVFHHAISASIAQRQRQLLVTNRSPSPRGCSIHNYSDSETSGAGNSPGSLPEINFFGRKSATPSGGSFSIGKLSVSNSATPSPSPKHSFSSRRRSKSPASKLHSSVFPSPVHRCATQPIGGIHVKNDQQPSKKSSPGLKLFKLFQNER